MEEIINGCSQVENGWEVGRQSVGDVSKGGGMIHGIGSMCRSGKKVVNESEFKDLMEMGQGSWETVWWES